MKPFSVLFACSAKQIRHVVALVLCPLFLSIKQLNVEIKICKVSFPPKISTCAICSNSCAISADHSGFVQYFSGYLNGMSKKRLFDVNGANIVRSNLTKFGDHFGLILDTSHMNFGGMSISILILNGSKSGDCINPIRVSVHSYRLLVSPKA
jgi:hypothetical protein